MKKLFLLTALLFSAQIYCENKIVKYPELIIDAVSKFDKNKAKEAFKELPALTQIEKDFIVKLLNNSLQSLYNTHLTKAISSSFDTNSKSNKEFAKLEYLMPSFFLSSGLTVYSIFYLIIKNNIKSWSFFASTAACSIYCFYKINKVVNKSKELKQEETALSKKTFEQEKEIIFFMIDEIKNHPLTQTTNILKKA